MTVTNETFFFITGANLVVVCIATIVILWRMPKAEREPRIGRADLGAMLRGETDSVRRAGDDQARGIRQEIGDVLKGGNDTTAKSLGLLLEHVRNLLDGFGTRLDGSLTTVDAKIRAIGQKLDGDIAAMGESAERGRETLRGLVETKLDASTAKQTEADRMLREEVAGNFHRLGGGLSHTLRELGDQQKERLEKNTGALTDFTSKQGQTSEALRVTVEQLLERLRQENTAKLEEMRLTVDEKLHSTLDARLGESFNRVVEQLNRVHEGLGEMKSLASNVGDLKNVLSNVKIRGTFGEVQLELLLEQFLSRDQYIKDAVVSDHSSERVEFAVKLPGAGSGEEVLIPIDAKFPREAYDRLVDAAQTGDAEEIKLFRKQLETQVRLCARTICDKYIKPPRTTDFAVLFLPTEGLYAEVLRQPGIIETMQRECRVVLAGPTTLAAILNSLQMGFRTVAIERRSSEVWKILSAVRTEFGKYNEVVNKLGKQLHTAAQSVDSLGTRARAMDRKLRDVEALPDAAASADLLGLDKNDGAMAEKIVGEALIGSQLEPPVLLPRPDHPLL